MRWLPRVAVAFTLSAFAIVALTWAGWPRPRSVTRIDALARVSFAAPLPGTASRHRLVQQGEFGNCDAGFWFLGPDGNLRGPWRPGRPMLLLGFDAVGRLLACSLYGGAGESEGVDRGGFVLARYDPATGHAENVITPDGPAPRDVRLSRDFSTLALARTDPLAVDIFDLPDGRKRTRLTFPDRSGGLEGGHDAWHHSRPKLAAPAWELSPDGQQLLLAEAWDGAKRLTPQGIEVYEVATGRLARRLTYRGDPVVPVGLPCDSADFGVGSIVFTADGRSVGYTLYRRRFADGVTRLWTIMTADVHHCNYASGDFQPADTSPLDPSDHFRERPVATDGDRVFWLREDSRELEGKPSAYRVTGASGAVLEDWRQLPGEFAVQSSLSATPRPGRPAVVYRYDEPRAKPVDSIVFWFARRLKPPTDVPTSTYLYHDWSTGEFRSFPGSVNGLQTHAVGPHDLAILTQDNSGGTLTVWDLPPPRPPWRWSVPAGIASGVLLTAAGVRLRGRGQLPAETRRDQ